MKFDELVINILEDVEEDMFLDALSGSPKKELVKRIVNKLRIGIKMVDERIMMWSNRANVKRQANILYTMSKKPFLNEYIKQELEKVDLDLIDIEYITKYGFIDRRDRDEERRKQKDLGNIK